MQISVVNRHSSGGAVVALAPCRHEYGGDYLPRLPEAEDHDNLKRLSSKAILFLGDLNLTTAGAAKIKRGRSPALPELLRSALDSDHDLLRRAAGRTTQQFGFGPGLIVVLRHLNNL